MAFISQIIQQHPDAGYWHQQYPWFSIGHLVDASNKKDTPAFPGPARRTALFFNDIPRLHWLLHQQEADVTALQALVHPKTGTIQKDSESQDVLVETDTIIPETANADENFGPAKEIPVQKELAAPETKAGTSVAKIIAAPVIEESTESNTVDELTTEPDEIAQSFTPAGKSQETIAEIVTPELSENENLKESITNDIYGT